MLNIRMTHTVDRVQARHRATCTPLASGYFNQVVVFFCTAITITQIFEKPGER